MPCGAGWCAPDVLRELVYTNREVTGEEALKIGLATFVEDDPLTRATAIAEAIATKNPHATRGAKRLFKAMHDADSDAILLAESEEQDQVIRKPNQVEAVMAAMQKRPPVFPED